MPSRLAAAILILALLDPRFARAQAPSFAFSWGSLGSGPAQFLSPVGVAIDGNGIVYVADTDLGSIKTFTRTGAYLSQWLVPYPKSVVVDTDGTILVAGSAGISRHTGSGFQLARWSASSSSVAVDSDRNVYANVWGGSQIQKFSSTGLLITQWGSAGSGDGQFDQPDGVAVDREGNVYVADLGNHRIQKFTSNGTFITKWGIFGAGAGQLDGPVRIAISPAGTVFVVDHRNDRVSAYTASGAYLYHWGSFGSGPGQFKSPIGIAVDDLGGVYIADKNNVRIQYFTFGVTPARTVSWSAVKARYR